MARETVWLVPHTHWDREWYEPFQRFRLRLVDLLDDVVARAEADPDFHFTLDGQMAAVDDYLEVRPEAAGRVAALVRGGQFAVGPWAILLDEFLCSGENIVRNLEIGLTRAGALGGAMRVGYLPDMFGHAAQMPQILAGAGLRRACVFRGVPAAITRHAFRWEAPDGTAVRAEYLPGGYGNAAELLADPDRLAAGTAGHLERMRPWYGSDPVLAMYGTDHSAPLPGLAAAVRTVAGAPDVALRLCTLDEYLALFDPDDLAGLPVWRGELRSHARANILPGVLSNRPHLKRTLSHAERMVERYAEPFAALWTPADRWPGRLLEMAWRRLVESSCHDSVTGCGVDETAVQVAARIAEAEQIGRGVRDRTLAELAGRVPAGSLLVVNPSPCPRTVLVRATVPVTGAGSVALHLPDGTGVPVQQVSGVDDGPLYTTVRPAADLAAGLRRGGLGLEFLALPVRDVVVAGERELLVTLGLGGSGITAAHRALAGTVADSGGDWRVRVVGLPSAEVFAMVPVPPLGWTVLAPGAGAGVPGGGGPVPGAGGVSRGDGPGAGRVSRSGDAVPGAGRVSRGGDAAVPEPVTVSGNVLDNGRLRVEVGTDGSLTLSGPDLPAVSGAGRLVDGGDAGDLYNYAPPDGDRLVTEPSSVRIDTVHTGPLVGLLRVHRRYRWNAVDAVNPDSPAGTEVLTEVELRAGEPFCRLAVTFENRHADHRLRLHVPLREPADRSYAEGQFAVVARGLASEGGHGEVPLPTFPAYGFVDAGGMAVLLDQVSEYEVVPGVAAAAPGELAVTLLRATGLISRADHPWRAEPAGPVIPTPQAQCIGQVVTTRLAVMPHRGGWEAAGVPAAAERFRLPPVVVAGTGAVDGPVGHRPTDHPADRQPDHPADRPAVDHPAEDHPVPGAIEAGSVAAGTAAGLSLTGDGVMMTSLRRRDARWLEVRVVAMTDAPTAAVLRPVRAARRADLLGRPGADLPVVDGAVRLPLRPWEIATVQVAS